MGSKDPQKKAICDALHNWREPAQWPTAYADAARHNFQVHRKRLWKQGRQRRAVTRLQFLQQLWHCNTANSGWDCQGHERLQERTRRSFKMMSKLSASKTGEGDLTTSQTERKPEQATRMCRGRTSRMTTCRRARRRARGAVCSEPRSAQDALPGCEKRE